jgi:phosphoglycerate dehydrogenase-like enzyme
MGGSRGRILITPRSVTRDGHPALEPLVAAGYDLVFSPPGRLPSEAELRELLPGCVGYLAGVEPVSAAVLRAAAPGLRVISRNGAGTDNIDLSAAAALGIAVRRAAGANARGVAELAWGLVLALVRSIPRSDAALKSREWKRREGWELAGRTLGIVGCGAVGRLVAGFGAAFGMRVLAHDPFPDPAFSAGPGFRFTSLDQVLAESGVLTLHCPAAGDQPLLDAARLARMPVGALLINTARAELVEEAAVLAALDSGRLGGYGVDVFRSEPPGDDPVVRHPRVVATPHLGGFTRESVDRAVAAAVEGLLAEL